MTFQSRWRVLLAMTMYKWMNLDFLFLTFRLCNDLSWSEFEFYQFKKILFKYFKKIPLLKFKKNTHILYFEHVSLLWHSELWHSVLWHSEYGYTYTTFYCQSTTPASTWFRYTQQNNETRKSKAKHVIIVQIEKDMKDFIDFFETSLKHPFPEGSLHEILRDGILLCR